MVTVAQPLRERADSHPRHVLHGDQHASYRRSARRGADSHLCTAPAEVPITTRRTGNTSVMYSSGSSCTWGGVLHPVTMRGLLHRASSSGLLHQGGGPQITSDPPMNPSRHHVGPHHDRPVPGELHPGPVGVPQRIHQRYQVVARHGPRKLHLSHDGNQA
jgi:hypothetical protein